MGEVPFEMTKVGRIGITLSVFYFVRSLFICLMFLTATLIDIRLTRVINLLPSLGARYM